MDGFEQNKDRGECGQYNYYVITGADCRWEQVKVNDSNQPSLDDIINTTVINKSLKEIIIGNIHLLRCY